MIIPAPIINKPTIDSCIVFELLKLSIINVPQLIMNTNVIITK